MLTLYYAKGTAALAPHIILEEVGADYDAVLIDFAKAEQRGAAFLAVNPKGRVPALVTDKGILTETAAILAYIAQTHPNAGIAPADPFEFGIAQAFNVYLAATMHVAHAHGGRAARWSDDEAAQQTMGAKVPENMAECVGLIASEYLQGPWVLGARYSICDAYLFTICRWLKTDGVDMADYPAVADHFAAIQARPAVKSVLALHT